jgi:hypothetical protein
VTAKELVSVWERAAAKLSEAVVRDPRTLDLGARLLRSHLLWRRAIDTAWQAAWAPFAPKETE